MVLLVVKVWAEMLEVVEVVVVLVVVAIFHLEMASVRMVELFNKVSVEGRTGRSDRFMKKWPKM
jgi:hypothetical protein